MLNNFIFPLAKLSDEGKRVLIVLLLGFIILFLLIGYIGLLIKKIMKTQGEKIEEILYPMTVSKVISEKKKFKSTAFKINNEMLFKSLLIPVLLMAISVGLYFGINAIYVHNDMVLDLFQYNNGIEANVGGTGFNTLLILHDFSQVGESSWSFKFLGSQFTIFWPLVINKIHFSVEAIPSYIIVPLFLTGAIWSLISVQAFIARLIKTYKLINSIFRTPLENYNNEKGAFVNETPKSDDNN